MKQWLSPIVACLAGCAFGWGAFFVGTTVGHSTQPVEIAPKQNLVEAGVKAPIANTAPTVRYVPPPPPVYSVTGIDEEVYRKLASVGCGIPCTADHPASRYHCGADEIAWEHSFSMGDETLNCLYAGKSAQACKIDCRR